MDVLRVLGDTLGLLQEMSTQIAAHLHPQISQPPTDAAAFTRDVMKTAVLSPELGSVLSAFRQIECTRLLDRLKEGYWLVFSHRSFSWGPSRVAQRHMA